MNPDEPEHQGEGAKPPPPEPPPPLLPREVFGEPDIPMPPQPRPGDRQRMRDARHNIELDLNRIKRRKRYGLFLTIVTVLFVAFVVLPVTWVGAYLFIDPPSNVLMMQRAAEGQSIRRYPVGINRMSPHIIRSVIAAEDANFCAHRGFDVEAIQEAMEHNARGGSRRGASTISQQVAKNLFLWPESSWLRKGFEVYFTAVLIEFMWPKRRIMEHYLNIAEWGDGHFGIEAAARALASRPPISRPYQAARLAAVLPSPNRWRADNPALRAPPRRHHRATRARGAKRTHRRLRAQLDRPRERKLAILCACLARNGRRRHGGRGPRAGRGRNRKVGPLGGLRMILIVGAFVGMIALSIVGFSYGGAGGPDRGRAWLSAASWRARHRLERAARRLHRRGDGHAARLLAGGLFYFLGPQMMALASAVAPQ